MNKEMNDRFEKLLADVKKPAQYIGGERNSETIPFDEAELSFAFCFADTYEIGMSHLGIKILYSIINSIPGFLCERVFMPWPDMGEKLKEEHIPLFSLESRTPVKDFDIVGFTLQYEMSYTNILEMLDMAGITVYAKDRGENDPLIVAGGPCAFNPEPLAPFFDAYMIGDGEELMADFVKTVRDAKKQGFSKEQTLRALSQLRGVYIPSLYSVTYNQDGTISSFTAKDASVPADVKKAIVRDLDKAVYPDKIPVPYCEIVHDRMVLEIMRGCTRGCRFCQAGMLYRPVRERRPETLLQQAERLEKATGYEELSLSSLSSGDYTQLPELIRSLMDRFSAKKVGVSLPSMRIDSIVKQSLEETQKVRKSGLTLAPEAGTQRLRDVINKGVTEEDLVRSVTDAFDCGWSSVKLYFMCGLPTETDEDLQGIAELSRKVVSCYFSLPKEKRARGLRVTSSVSVFVPKPFTPFQWAAQDHIETVNQKITALREYLRIKGVTFNWHEPELSYLEACVSRGDRRIADVIYTAWKKGCKLDSWNEYFRFDLWMEAFKECGLDPDFYACRERSYDEILPWDFIDAGVTKQYLQKENEKAKQGAKTPDCRNGCNGCGLQREKGVCSFCENAGRV